MAWRALPPSRLLVQHLKEECERARHAIAGFVETGEVGKAGIATGGLRSFESLLSVLHPPERVQPAPEEEYRDPATIVAPRMKAEVPFRDPATIVNPGKKS